MVTFKETSSPEIEQTAQAQTGASDGLPAKKRGNVHDGHAADSHIGGFGRENDVAGEESAVLSLNQSSRKAMGELDACWRPRRRFPYHDVVVPAEGKRGWLGLTAHTPTDWSHPT